MHHNHVPMLDIHGQKRGRATDLTKVLAEGFLRFLKGFLADLTVEGIELHALCIPLAAGKNWRQRIVYARLRYAKVVFGFHADHHLGLAAKRESRDGGSKSRFSVVMVLLVNQHCLVAHGC